MRVALVNPRWSFEGSIYFGCQAAHLPLELGYARALLQNDGHEAILFDGQFDDCDNSTIAQRINAENFDYVVITTAPTYLFWRCTQPELRVPAQLISQINRSNSKIVAIGPHGSVTPKATLRKLQADYVIRGESEEPLAILANGILPKDVPGLVSHSDENTPLKAPHAGEFCHLPALTWPQEWISKHHHHHHRFDPHTPTPGAEIEASRGCPYHCSFCAKIEFRDTYRKRDLATLLAEIDGLIAQGVGYFYFIDEIYLPDTPLLNALRKRQIKFGIQTRIDLWKPAMITLLADAGCVSIEAGVESLSIEGRARLAKQCRMDNDALAERLIFARHHIPFVQANLLAVSEDDDPRLIAEWRARLSKAGVWSNDPVPLFPYPSSPDYRRLFGAPDDQAWERAHAHYLTEFSRMSDLQDQKPLSLSTLERSCC